MSTGLIAKSLRLAVLLSPFAVPLLCYHSVSGACPNTQVHLQACPDPSTVTTCERSYLLPELCDNGEGQYKSDGYFGCKTATTATECLDGTAQDLMVCYTEVLCIWAQNTCVQFHLTAVPHYKVRKVTRPCAPPPGS
jgi:hypothetical protein